MLIEQTLDKLHQLKLTGMAHALGEQRNCRTPTRSPCPSRIVWGCWWIGNGMCERAGA